MGASLTEMRRAIPLSLDQVAGLSQSQACEDEWSLSYAIESWADRLHGTLLAVATVFLTGIPFFKMPSPSARALPPKNQPLFAIFQGSALLLKGMAFTARLHTLSAEAEKGHVTSE